MTEIYGTLSIILLILRSLHIPQEDRNRVVFT